MTSTSHWFPEARYGLLARGEWVLNREAIPVAEYKKLADRFTAEKFDAGELHDLK